MNRKEKVFSYINSKEYVPLKLSEMQIVLDVPDEDADKLELILSELCLEGKIYKTKKGRYASIVNGNNVLTGKLNCNINGFFGFVIPDVDNKEDVYVSAKDMADAVNNDKVVVHIDKTKNDKGHCEGHIVNILERGNEIVIGTIAKISERYYAITADNKRIYPKIKAAISDDDVANVGDRVAVKPLKYEKNVIYGDILSVLGEASSLKACIEGIIIENKIKQEFDDAVIAETKEIPQTVSAERYCEREDLRDMLIFTIDGDDARDFDDAVSLTTNEYGNYILGVHIADVSEYVKENSAIENEAYKRATSVYLADRVIPMLPEKLSNGICSLNPNVDRLTLSVFMEIDKSGNVINHRISKTIIRSKARMTYNNVNKILDKDPELTEEYSSLLDTLFLMNDLAEILNKKRSKRGSIQFDFPESHIILNELCEPIDIQKEIRGTSNKIIEEFMLIANETVAEYAFWSDLPFVFRNHDAPSAEKLTAFNDFIKTFGIALKEKISVDAKIHSKALQQVLDDVKDTPNEQIIASNMLRSLMKAKYSEENLGHFGLAAKYYCHFTSPIRRYPDLTIHRILKDFIDGNLTSDRINYFSSYTKTAAAHSNDCEMNAEKAERDVDDLMKASYMSSYIGTTFEGVVSSVTNFGMFVELENTVEGLIRLENMTDDYYIYDETTKSLKGKRKQKIYTTGIPVKVVLARADILSRQIDFVLEQNASKKLLNKFTSQNSAKRNTQKKHKHNYKHRQKKRKKQKWKNLKLL